jgi:hypothetical protein
MECRSGARGAYGATESWRALLLNGKAEPARLAAPAAELAIGE